MHQWLLACDSTCVRLEIASALHSLCSYEPALVLPPSKAAEASSSPCHRPRHQAPATPPPTEVAAPTTAWLVALWLQASLLHAHPAAALS